MLRPGAARASKSFRESATVILPSDEEDSLPSGDHCGSVPPVGRHLDSIAVRTKRADVYLVAAGFIGYARDPRLEAPPK